MEIFKTFGCRVVAHVKEKRLKLDAKSREGIFVGYNENIKDYKVYFQQDSKIEILSDIIFLLEESEAKKKVNNIAVKRSRRERRRQ